MILITPLQPNKYMYVQTTSVIRMLCNPKYIFKLLRGLLDKNATLKQCMEQRLTTKHCMHAEISPQHTQNLLLLAK